MESKAQRVHPIDDIIRGRVHMFRILSFAAEEAVRALACAGLEWSRCQTRGRIARKNTLTFFVGVVKHSSKKWKRKFTSFLLSLRSKSRYLLETYNDRIAIAIVILLPRYYIENRFDLEM